VVRQIVLINRQSIKIEGEGQAQVWCDVKISRLLLDALSSSSLCLILLLPIINSSPNRILGQHRTMQLHRGQFQMGGNICILDGEDFVNVLALDPFGGYGGRGNGRAASECFEFGFLDVAVFVYFDLKLFDEDAIKR
jgi:hypothetical protein